MKVRHLALAGVLALFGAVAAAWWWWFRPTAPREVAEVSAHASDDPLLRDRWEARRGAGDAQAPCSARGRVSRASDRTGVAGAAVALTRPHIISSAGPVVVTTDASGHWSAEGLPPGRYDVTVTSADFGAAALRGVVLSAGRDHAGIDQALERDGTPVVGVVADPTGAPIVGARVEVIRWLDQGLQLPAVFAAITDPRGRYALRLAVGRYAVGVVHRDHVRVRSSLLVTEAPRARDFRLVPGGSMRGRVIARGDGRPIAGASLRLHGRDTLSFNMDSSGFEPLATTDAEGGFELRGLPSGAVSLIATAPGWTNVEATAVPLGVAEHVENVEILVDPARRLAGYVVAAEDETAGVADVIVSAFDFANPAKTRFANPTKSDGYFAVEGLAPGTYQLIAWGTTTIPSFDAPVEIGDRDIEDHLIRTGRGYQVRGRVEPQADATLTAWIDLRHASQRGVQPMMSSLMSTFRPAHTREDGAFELGPLAQGEYVIEARTVEGLRGSIVVDVGDSDLNPAPIQLVPGHRVSGRVRDPTGRPVVGVNVSLEPKEQKLLSMTGMLSGSGFDSVTDDAGRFEIAGLQPGKYNYRVQDDLRLSVPWANPDDQGPLARTRIADVRADLELDLVVATELALVGRAVDDVGNPVAGAWVVAWPELSMAELTFGQGMVGGGRSPANLPDELARGMSRQLSPVYALPAVVSGADGSFRLEGLRRPRYTVTTHAQRGQLIARVENVRPTEPIEVTLQPVGALHGRLVGSPPGGDLEIRLDGPDIRRLLVRESDEFSLERLNPGRWRVVVQAPGGVAAGDVDVKSGTTTEVELQLTAWSSLTGTLVDATSGGPVTGLHAMVERNVASSDEAMAQAMQYVGLMQGGRPGDVDTNGRFTIDHLPAGPVTVRFLAMPQLHLRAELHVADLRAAEARDLGTVRVLSLEVIPADKRGSLGLSTDRARAPGVNASLTVRAVAKGSPADRAGVAEGDVVVSIDDFAVSEFGADVIAELLALRHVRAGQERRVSVRRADGSQHSFTLRATPHR